MNVANGLECSRSQATDCANEPRRLITKSSLIIALLIEIASRRAEPPAGEPARATGPERVILTLNYCAQPARSSFIYGAERIRGALAANRFALPFELAGRVGQRTDWMD